MPPGGFARVRLANERKKWRKDHPHGFMAKPETLNPMVWHCIVPGEAGTDSEGGYFPLTLHFSDDHPIRPPQFKFAPGLDTSSLRAGYSANPVDPDSLFIQDPVEYKRRVRQQVKQYPHLV